MFSWLWENLLSMGLTLIMLMSEVSLRKMKLTSKVREGWSWWKQIATLKFEFLVVSIHFFVFLSDPGIPGVRSMCPSLSNYDTFFRLNWCDSGWWGYQLNTNWCQWGNSRQCGNAVTQSGGQLWKQCKLKIPSQYKLIMPIGQSKAMCQCKWLNLVESNASDAI